MSFRRELYSVRKVESPKREETIESCSVYRHEWDDERNDWLNYLYQKSGCNADLVMTFLSENDSMGIDRPSINLGTGGYRAYGICQLYYQYHSDFIDSDDFLDPYKQMNYCIGVYQDAENRGILPTTFYAYNFRHNALKKLMFSE